jgi:1,2-diacylglycerol 3-beta-galactosyltransferase
VFPRTPLGLADHSDRLLPCDTTPSPVISDTQVLAQPPTQSVTQSLAQGPILAPGQGKLPIQTRALRQMVTRAASARRTVLFLIAETGAGHHNAAAAIAGALRLQYEHEQARGRPTPTLEIHIVDAFAKCARPALRAAVSCYGPVTQHGPRLYGYAFHLTNSKRRFGAVHQVYHHLLQQGLRALIADTRPDIIVSVHPLLNHSTLRVLEDLGTPTPLVTVVTDLVEAHAAWFAPDVAACVVPTPHVRDVALLHGIDADRVPILGIPIDPAFTIPAASPRPVRRAALGLQANLPVVLVMGGGDGAGGLAQAALALANGRLHAQLVVVTGRNYRLYARLRRLEPHFQTPTHILGFVHNMPELMHAADVVVTKAGPGTICEALTCGVPLVFTGAIPGQEEANLTSLVEHGVGVLATSPRQLMTHIRQLIDRVSPQAQQMRAHIGAYAPCISRPTAAYDIARLIDRIATSSIVTPAASRCRLHA